jgi:hypothetical protein
MAASYDGVDKMALQESLAFCMWERHLAAKSRLEASPTTTTLRYREDGAARHTLLLKVSW